jgi:Leucine-rich repeat (LRR) protein/exopolysaccharide biosynthesis protein
MLRHKLCGTLAAIFFTINLPGIAEGQICTGGIPANQADSSALVALYNATNGDMWKPFTVGVRWKTGPVVSWGGISGLNQDCRVRFLSLTRLNLNGMLPAELGNLSEATFINIIDNSGMNGDLHGPIPTTLGNLKKLETLALHTNNLTGEIPISLGDLPNLKSLHLGRNQLTGSIPPDLGKLSNLEILQLFSNRLDGSIPAALGDLSKLRDLVLSFNQLSGPIPDLSKLTNLGNLDLSSNQLTGPIPDLSKLTNLTVLRLNSNQLSGAIPAALGNLSNLQLLWLNNNQLDGVIPTDLGKLTKLQFDLNLASNQLSGTIPSDLGKLTNLQTLNLSLNQLSGAIPDDLSKLTNLLSLSLSNNKLTGAVPPSFANLTKLTGLFLQSNQLEDLPNLTGLSALRNLFLENNRFTFEDLEPNVPLLTQATVRYSPQDSVDTFIEDKNGQIRVFVNVGGRQTKYQWSKNNTLIAGATESSYTLSNLNDTGPYRCVATNDLLPNLILISRQLAVKCVGWMPRDDLNASLPSSIRVFENCAIPVWLVRAKPSPSEWSFKTASALASDVWNKKTVSSFASGSNAIVAINGGFFDTAKNGKSLSLVASEGALLIANVGVLTREGKTYYPTRATFGLLDDGSMDFKWTYHVLTPPSTRTLFAYPQPAPNADGNPQKEPPSSSGGVVWTLDEGIGGGPMLVKDGAVHITWEEEVFFGGGLPIGTIDKRDPRTAMGITKTGELLLIVADGRCADGTPDGRPCADGSKPRQGISHREMAELMVSLGAHQAMNLDGGGSSALVVKMNNKHKLINKPSGKGRERPVTSAIVLAPAGLKISAATFDTGDDCCYAEEGNWLENADGSFFGSTPARLNEVGNGTDRAVWRFQDITPGNYEVAAWWVPGSDRATNTPYTIFQSGVGKATAGSLGKAAATIRVNQSDPATADRWNILGTFKLAPGDSIVMTDDAVGTGSPSYVVADAIRLTAATGTGVASSVEAPAAFRLEPNYPNPFNRSTARSPQSPATTIRFTLPKSSRVEISIYNLFGQQIKTLLSQTMQPGEQVVVWDGRNDAGELVTSGVYFYRLQAGDFVQSRKMVFVR